MVPNPSQPARCTVAVNLAPTGSPQSTELSEFGYRP